MNFLLDTNIIIGLEDDGPIKQSFATLSALRAERSATFFVSPANVSDVSEDNDNARRTATISKVAKYKHLQSIPDRYRAQIASETGVPRKTNDEQDIALLSYVLADAVDYLISEDKGVHRRAQTINLSDRVLFVADAISLLRESFDQRTLALPHIKSRKAYEIDPKAEIFDSLREGYPGFDEWFKLKCAREQRDCWTVEIADEIVGIVIYKTEDATSTDAISGGDKILKLCTFKMQPNYRGERFGEHLLKQALWYAFENQYDSVYLTAYEDQTALLTLLSYFGFQNTYRNENNESVIEKKLEYGDFRKPNSMPAIQANKILYPNFYDGEDTGKFIVPIKPSYHETLFPELNGRDQLPLFGPGYIEGPILNSSRTPGNTIRKVYLSRTNTNSIKPGDIILFYALKEDGFQFSQRATTIGIVEGFSEAKDRAALSRMVAKRSVFSEAALDQFFEDNSKPVKVMDFILVGHLKIKPDLNTLISLGVCNKQAPQTAAMIDPEAWKTLRSKVKMTP